MEPDVYRRGGPWVTVFGAIFLVAGLGFHLAILGQYASGKPIPISVNGERVENPATWAQIGVALFPLIHATVGALVIVYSLRARIELREEGIVAYGLFRKPVFDALWGDVVEMKDVMHGDIHGIKLKSRTQELVIPSNMHGWSELRKTIDQRLWRLRERNSRSA